MFEKILAHKKSGKIIGITFSSFDLLHAGHVLMLAEAKSHCDILIAGLQTDPTIDRPNKNKPLQSVYERWTQLSALSSVDYVIPYATEEEVIDILQSVRPHLRILGEEYKDGDFTGKHVEGVTNVYNKRQHRFSSSGLRELLSDAN